MRLQNEVEHLEATVQRLEEKIDALDVTGTTTFKRPNVAFRTQLTHDVGTVHKGHVIIFDKVELNLGNGYDIRHGTFTAAYNGTYQFSMSLGNPSGQHGNIYLMKNGKAVEFVFVGYDQGWEMASESTVVELLAGDDVWVEGEAYIGGQLSIDHLHTGFSGFLIRTM